MTRDAAVPPKGLTGADDGNGRDQRQSDRTIIVDLGDSSLLPTTRAIDMTTLIAAQKARP